MPESQMTDEQIIKLVKEHFTEEWCEEDGWGWVEFAGKPDAFLKFAKALYDKGYDEGYSNCSIDMGDENV